MKNIHSIPPYISSLYRLRLVTPVNEWGVLSAISVAASSKSSVASRIPKTPPYGCADKTHSSHMVYPIDKKEINLE